ncbi:MAG: hypothetical protein NT075_19575 [Chloroflexi bacterium]|nr:hypothetical protein [Chloroflexota bacterium]
MNKLQILGREGHRELVWENERVAAQDPEALAAVAEAEQILNEALSRGYAAFRVDSPDEPAVRINKFDATAPRTVVVPRLVGG